MGSSFRAAGKAFCWWQVSILMLAIVMYAAAPLVVRAQAGQITDLPGMLSADDWLLEHTRRTAIEIGSVISILLAIYWLLAGAGLAATTIVRSADALLLLGLFCLIALWANAYLGLINTYCDVLPFPHEGFRLDRFHECPTSMSVAGLLGLIGLGLGLLSLLVRIVVSRLAKPQSESA